MKLLIDDADMEKIRRIYDLYPVDGVTTNPSILARTAKNPWRVLKEIRTFIGPDAELHVQALSPTAADMLREGQHIASCLGDNTFIKIPAIPEGFKAMRLLADAGLCVTATAVYTVQQAWLAAKAGALYAAPYVNRMDNLGYDGLDIARRIHDLFTVNGLHAQVLGASFKNTQQVLALAEYGVGAATVAPDVIDALTANPAVDAAVAAFAADFARAFGDGTTMLTTQ